MSFGRGFISPLLVFSAKILCSRRIPGLPILFPPLDLAKVSVRRDLSRPKVKPLPVEPRNSAALASSFHTFWH